MNMACYNVLVKQPTHAFLLTLEGFSSKAEAERAIKWQRKGDFHQPMYVVEPAKRINHWRILSGHGENCAYNLYVGGQPVRADKRGWTKSAWKQFLARHWPAKNLTLH